MTSITSVTTMSSWYLQLWLESARRPSCLSAYDSLTANIVSISAILLLLVFVLLLVVVVVVVVVELALVVALIPDSNTNKDTNKNDHRNSK